MAIFKLQIALPDRPGSLGAVASAIGFAGADIRSRVTIKSEDSRELMTLPSRYLGVTQLICLKYLTQSEELKFALLSQ